MLPSRISLSSHDCDHVTTVFSPARLASEIDAMIARRKDASSLPPSSSSFWSIISSDASPTYAFSLPFVAHAWQTIVGARPLIILVGKAFSRGANNNSGGGNWISVLLSQLKTRNIKYIIMDPSSASPATFSQLVRLFAFKLADIAANDYIVASDRCMEVPLNVAAVFTSCCMCTAFICTR